MTKVLRGLGPLMGLLALGAPLFSQPSAMWSGGSSNAPERRLAMGLTPASSSLFHPLVTLLGLAVAGSSVNQVQPHPSALLGWDALRATSLRGSIWMVRDRWMNDRLAPRQQTSLASLLRC